MNRHVLRGRLVSDGVDVADGVVAVEGDRIAFAGPAARWSPGRGVPGTEPGWPAAQTFPLLLPGLVDVHCHGGAGHSFPDARAEGVRVAARHHLAHGTTSLVGSLVSAPVGEIARGARELATAVADGHLAGVHLEGPFLAASRCGAQDPGSLTDPDPAALERWLEAGAGTVRSMTYAPERPGAEDLVDRLLAAGVVPCVGHTDGDHDVVRRSLRRVAGTRPAGVTHLFNGMPPLHHRAPGPVGAALAAAAAGEGVVELVADGTHLAPGTVATVMALLGPHRVALVTDAMAAAGMPDGTYPLGPQTVEVTGGVARLAGPQPAAQRSIAGGTARLVDVVRHCVQAAGVPLGDAVTAATSTPAALLGLDDVGRLAAGLRADVLAVDDDLRPVAVLHRGGWARR